MPRIRKLISKIESYPVLYKKKRLEYQKQEEIWVQIAQECEFEDGQEAFRLWNKLLEEYIEYMSSGHPFYYNKEMRFMQSYIVDTHSESSDIDEETLLEAINDYSDHENEFDIETTILSKKSRGMTPAKLQMEKQIQADMSTKSHVNVLADSSSSAITSVMSTEISGFSSLQLIFLGYAKILQDLPLSVQIRTKHKIAQIINEAELSLIETNEINESKK